MKIAKQANKIGNNEFSFFFAFTVSTWFELVISYFSYKFLHVHDT